MSDDPALPPGELLDKALRASEGRYRTLFDASPLPTFVYDMDTLRYLAVNQAAVDVYGWTREEFLSMRVTDIRPPEEVPRLLATLDLLPAARRNLGSWRHRKKDGSEIEVEVISQEFLEGGRRARLLTATDVTERRRMERELQEKEERFHAAFEATPDAINLTRVADGVYVDVNEGFERITGYRREEVIGRTGRELELWAEPERRAEVVAALLRDGLVRDVELRFRTKGGRILLGLLSARIATLHGVPHVVSITRDITERRRAAEEKAQLLDQLRQAQKLEAVGRLAGGVAHDFNNMLMVIANHAEFLQGELPPGSRSGEDLEQIREAARRATAITRQLLAFSRKQMLQPRRLDPNALVAELEKMLRSLIGEHVELRCTLQPGVAAVRADPDQLSQVLVNLAINARDAMPGGGRLTLETAGVRLDEAWTRLHPEMQPGDWVRLSVGDTGVGMDAETLAHAFEPFFTTKGSRGTGLGLATVYGIVKQSGGHVFARSEPGRGSTFEVYLPAQQGAAEEAPAPPPPLQPAGGGETVLVVEDDALVREAVREAVERSGYRALVAAGGAEAEALAGGEQGPIHLLLTDVVMPGLDGRAVARRLQALRPGLRVIFMSGYTENSIVHHGIVDAGIDFIEKPFTRQQIAARIREALGRPPKLA